MISNLIKAAAPFMILLSMCSSRSKPKNAGNEMTGKFAVVELFTSEGCSSCPAADEAVASAAKEYGKDVFVLAYHVDYWDRLGWKDPFSSAAYSARQSRYASVMNLESIYTPQVIVNGQSQFVGSNTEALHRSIDKALKKEEGMMLKIIATVKNNNEITVNANYEITKFTKNTINIALVQSYAETSVKRGENGGRKLHHINIVRELMTLPEKDSQASVKFIIPGGLKPSDCRVIAFLQDKSLLEIRGAVEAVVE